MMIALTIVLALMAGGLFLSLWGVERAGLLIAAAIERLIERVQTPPLPPVIVRVPEVVIRETVRYEAPPVEAIPAPAPARVTCVLMSADLQTEHSRQTVAAETLPASLHRPHGKDPLVSYRLVQAAGDVGIYQEHVAE